jgi:hypothetical protein
MSIVSLPGKLDLKCNLLVPKVTTGRATQMQQTSQNWTRTNPQITKVPGKAIIVAVAVALLSFAFGVLFGQNYSGQVISNNGPRSISPDTVHGRFGHVTR